MIILNLALPERTCYEPLASTHPDRQGIADHGRARRLHLAAAAPWAALLLTGIDRLHAPST